MYICGANQTFNQMKLSDVNLQLPKNLLAEFPLSENRDEL